MQLGFKSAVFAAFWLGLAIAPCATATAESPGWPTLEAADKRDPFEEINRRIYGFNRAAYDFAIDPALVAYQDRVPASVRDGVANFFHNLQNPLSAANSALAGEWALSAHYLRRFTVNSTFGLMGVLDVAEELGGGGREAFSFGDLLCAYDVPPGPYVVIPVLGPANLRTAVGRVVEVATESLVLGDYLAEAYLAGVYVHEYERVRNARNELELTSVDAYAAVRSIVRQTEMVCGPLS